jgi:MFS family permease
VRLGLRANLAQFSLLVGVNALVGGMVGQERSLLSLLATQIFGLAAVSAALTYIVAFGLAKAATNFLAGTLADRYGRKPVLIVGWLLGLPVPLLIIWAPTWSWIVAANVLLGVNQGLCWSTTVIMKIDLAGPTRRGLAMGLNEAAGYLAVALTAYLTGLIAAQTGLRPEPFYLGLAYAGIGLGLSTLLVHETHGHAQLEAQLTDPGRTTDPASGVARPPAAASNQRPSTREILLRTSLREPALSACSQAGLVNNLNDGLAWGLFPLLFVRGGLPVAQVGLLAALYPAVWGLGQLLTGPLSDRLGRKPLITGGMLLQALALAGTALASSFRPGRPAPSCSGSAPPWSTPPCWPRSATSPTPAGAPPGSASTGYGATPASPSAPCSPGWSPPSLGQVRGRRRPPAGRPWPHRGRPQAVNRRWPCRAGRRLRPWVAAWWRACSAWAWAAVIRQWLRQRHRRQRAWCGSQPRPRSSTRNGTAAAPSALPCASATRRPATVECRLMPHRHRSGRPGCGGGADGPGRPPAAARPWPDPGGTAVGQGERRPVGRTGSRTTAGRCGGGRTHRPDGAGHTGGNV